MQGGSPHIVHLFSLIVSTWYLLEYIFSSGSLKVVPLRILDFISGTDGISQILSFILKSALS